jgi:predicted DNA-binding transcriptional regulator AlpA
MARKRTVSERLEESQKPESDSPPQREDREVDLPFERPWGKATLAAYLGVTESGLDKLIAIGRVPPGFRAGRLWRWRPDVVRDWVTAREEESRAANKKAEAA